MNTVEAVVFAILLLISAGAFMINGFQFNERGPLFHNAYLYASKEERGPMNKKPYYKQSAIIFLLLGLAFFLNAMGVLVIWFSYVGIFVLMVTIVYAVVSSPKKK